MSPNGLNSLETRMKVSSPNYNFKIHSVLAQTIGSSHNSAYLENVFLTISTEYKSVSCTMVCTPCLEGVYLDIRNQLGCLCVTSFLKAELSVYQYFANDKNTCTVLFFETVYITSSPYHTKSAPYVIQPLEKRLILSNNLLKAV